jgi:hypothetical protein
MELKRKLPKRNTWVQTKRGDGRTIQGRVVDTQILTQLVVVESEGGERTALSVEDIKPMQAPPKRDKPAESKSEEKKDDTRPRKRGGPPRRSRRGGRGKKKQT